MGKLQRVLDQTLLWLGLGVVTAASLIVAGFVLKVYYWFLMLGWNAI